MRKKSARKTHGRSHPYFSANLRWWMQNRGFSREDLANSAGMTQQNIGYYLRNIRMPDYSVVERLAEALDVPVPYLWDIVPPPGGSDPFIDG